MYQDNIKSDADDAMAENEHGKSFLKNQEMHTTNIKNKVNALLNDDTIIAKDSDIIKPIVHFNNAGASPSPKPVLQTIIQHTLLEAEFDGYHAAQIQSNNLNQVYKSIQTLIQAKSTNEIAIVESATVGWTRIFYSMMKDIQKDDVILCSEVEYAANVVAMQQIVLERDAKLVVLPSLKIKDSFKSSGIVDVTILNDALNGDYKLPNINNYLDPNKIYMICITHIPTNCGIINPVYDIGTLVHDYNKKYRKDIRTIYYIIDACQSIGQVPIDVQRMKCSALTASGRKYLRGPRGTGFLYIEESICDSLDVSHVDHFSAKLILNENDSKPNDDGSILSIQYKTNAQKFEFWESNISNRLGLGAAIEYALSNNMQSIQQKCTHLSDELRCKLRTLPDIHIHHDITNTTILQSLKNQDMILQDYFCGIVTFHIKNYDSVDLKQVLFEEYGILTSAVPALSTPFDSINSGLVSKNNNSRIDLLRVSLSYFNTVDEIDYFCDSLRSIID